MTSSQPVVTELYSNTTHDISTGTWTTGTGPTGTWTTGTGPTAHVLPLQGSISTEVDIVIGVVLVLCLLFGAPANVLSLVYFAFKQKSEGLLLVLYVAISCTDICICLLHLPVTILLFNGRKATLFRSKA